MLRFFRLVKSEYHQFKKAVEFLVDQNSNPWQPRLISNYNFDLTLQPIEDDVEAEKETSVWEEYLWFAVPKKKVNNVQISLSLKKM